MEKAAVKNNNPVMGILKVLVMMYVLTGIFLVVLTAVLYKFQISEKAVNVGIVLIYVLSCLAGGFVIGKIKRNRKYLWGMAVGAAYFAILLIVSFALHQEIGNGAAHFVTTVLMCIAAGAAGGMIS